VTSLILL